MAFVCKRFSNVGEPFVRKRRKIIWSVQEAFVCKRDVAFVDKLKRAVGRQTDFFRLSTNARA